MKQSTSIGIVVGGLVLLAVCVFFRALRSAVVVVIVVMLIFIINSLVMTLRQNTLRNMAKDTIEAFNNKNIQYWTDYGTLLGLVREGDIIRHDTDCDFCLVPDKDMHNKMLSCMPELAKKNKDYILEYHPWGAYRLKLGALHVDIYITEIKDGKYVDPTGNLPVEYVGTIQKMDWNDLPVNVPEKVHETLVWRYGENYMTPVVY